MEKNKNIREKTLGPGGAPMAGQMGVVAGPGSGSVMEGHGVRPTQVETPAAGNCDQMHSGADPWQGSQPQGQNPGNGQTGFSGANPGQPGPTGMPTGQTGFQPAGNDPQGQIGNMGGASPPGSFQTGPSPGQFPGMGQADAPGMNPGQMSFYPGAHPGTPPQANGGMPAGSAHSMGPYPGYPGSGQMGVPGVHPGQTGYQPGWDPGAGVQGPGGMPGMETNPHMGSSMEGHGSSHMGADAHHIYHDENRFGQVADMVGRFLKGEANTDDIVNGLFSLNFRDDQFWKGAIAGVIVAMLLSSDMVKQGLAKSFGAVFQKGKDEKEGA